MDKNMELLNYIYKNTNMGVVTIKKLLTIVLDDSILKVLREQLKDYQAIKKECEKISKEYNGDLIGIDNFKITQSTIMIQLKTMFNNSTEHIKSMMIKGSKMGIENIKSKLKEFKKCDENVISLGKKLLEIEENNLKKLEKI
jgi:hypothetical protein